MARSQGERAMINIHISDNAITLTGHAEYAPTGRDIVCAGISALHYALTAYLGQFNAYKIDIKNLSSKQKGAVDSFVLGAEGIAETYPECVAVRDDRAKP
jgi:uncharacterized protein YsxB (DUF464 family)